MLPRIEDTVRIVRRVAATSIFIGAVAAGTAAASLDWDTSGDGSHIKACTLITRMDTKTILNLGIEVHRFWKRGDSIGKYTFSECGYFLYGGGKSGIELMVKSWTYADAQAAAKTFAMGYESDMVAPDQTAEPVTSVGDEAYAVETKDSRELHARLGAGILMLWTEKKNESIIAHFADLAAVALPRITETASGN